MTADAKKLFFSTAENNSARKGLRYKKKFISGTKSSSSGEESSSVGITRL